MPVRSPFESSVLTGLGLPAQLVERWIPQLAANPPRVALSDGEDIRAIQAAATLSATEAVIPVLVGRSSRIRAVAARADVLLPASVEVLDVETAGRDQDVARALAVPGTVPEQFAERLTDSLFVTAAMLRLGRIDAAVGGATRTTADVLRAGIRIVGLERPFGLVSSCFLMALQDGRILAYGDCAVLPEPTDEQLAEIAVATAGTYERLTGLEPLVAMLSFSTRGSAQHPAVTKVQRATEMVRSRRPDLVVDGELQFDAALVETVGRSKATPSNVAGRANVLIFPDLGSGNIGYKITERLAHATAVGPILQGLARPLNDLSRGCSDTDIVGVALTSAMQAHSRAAMPVAPESVRTAAPSQPEE
jgi:phosphotransacetylase